MTSRSELRRQAIQAGEPAPEFPPVLPGADAAQPVPGTKPAASSSTLDGAAAKRAVEGVPPSPLAPAPESAPPVLPGPSGPSSPSMHPQHEEDGPDSSPPGTGSSADAPVLGGTTGLAGEDFRKAVRAAQSARAKEKRTGRGRYPVKRRGDGYAPGANRRMPPGGAA